MFQFFPFNFLKKRGEKANELKDWQENQFFKDIVYTAPVAMYTCDKEGKITFYNQAAAALLGGKPVNNEIWNDSFKLFHLDGRPMSWENTPTARTLKEGIAINNEELTLELPDGFKKQLLVSSRPIFDNNNNNNNNNFIGVHKTLIDISEKVAFRHKENIFSNIVSSSNDAIISKDLNGIITSWNSGAEYIFGYTEKETIGKHITMLIPEDRLQEEDHILQNIRQGKKINHYETVRLHKSGKLIPLSLTISPLKDSNNKIIGASKIARDITELIQTQEMLKSYIDNLEILNSIGKLISEQLDVNVILQRVTDATTKITGASFGAFFYNTKDENDEEMLLYTLSGAPREAFEKVGKPRRHTDLFKPTFLNKETIRVDDVTKDPRYGKNSPHSGIPTGHLPVVSYMSVPVVSMQGQIIGGLLFGHHKPGVFTAEHEDIISSIASQSAVALENSELFQKVKALNEKKDEFIALASHELKTPLTSIKGYLQLLQKKADPNTDKTFIDRALHQVEKLNILIADLLNVSKIEAGKLEFNMEEFDIQTLITDTIDIFSHSHKSHTIIYNSYDKAFNIYADKQRIEQVLINLFSNAIKYSPKANKVYVELTAIENEVCIKVKDEGIGLDETQLKNLFTKFYRAENIANVSGLGLGLYLSKEIVNRHNGEMTVISKKGKGSEFCFTLPYTS